MNYYIYILANKRNGTLYIGVTNDLLRGVNEHKNDVIKGFTNQYKVHDLVYFEEFGSIDEAILREKRLKKWKRQWKIKLINQLNPEWRDLYASIC